MNKLNRQNRDNFMPRMLEFQPDIEQKIKPRPPYRSQLPPWRSSKSKRSQDFCGFIHHHHPSLPPPPPASPSRTNTCVYLYVHNHIHIHTRVPLSSTFFSSSFPAPFELHRFSNISRSRHHYDHQSRERLVRL